MRHALFVSFVISLVFAFGGPVEAQTVIVIESGGQLTGPNAPPPPAQPAVAPPPPGYAPVAPFQPAVPQLREPGELEVVDESNFGARLSGEIIGGAVALGATYGLVALGTYAIYNDCGSGLECVGGVVLGGIVAVAASPFSTAGGVRLGGGLAGGRGAWWASMVGAQIGQLVGAIPLLATASSDTYLNETEAGLVLTAIPVMTLVGAVVAYELSHRARVRRGARQTRLADETLLAPTLAVDDTGATLGLSGAF